MSAASPAPGLAERFTFILRDLQAFLAHRMFIPEGIHQRDAFVPFGLLWKRLERLTAQFTALVAFVADGGAIASPPPPNPVRPTRAGPRSWSPDPLSRRTGWLIVLLGAEIIERGIELKQLFATPEFAALLAAAPEMASLLRPLCRTLCIPCPQPPQGAPPSKPVATTRRPARPAGAPSAAWNPPTGAAKTPWRWTSIVKRPV